MEHGHSSRSLTQERRVSSTVSAARRGGRIVVIPGVLSSYRALEYGLKIAPVERQRGFEPHSPQPFFLLYVQRRGASGWAGRALNRRQEFDSSPG
jgi:hypothetical protein